MKLSKVEAMRIPKGAVKRLRHNGQTLWEPCAARYVSFGDSIAVGHRINDNWEKDYGWDAQYGVDGRTETVIVPGSYTNLIHRDLITRFGVKVNTTSFARSGDKVTDLMDKLNQTPVRNALSKADYVTVCIGANDVLHYALTGLAEYLNTGDLSTIDAQVDASLAVLNDDNASTSYLALFNKLMSINAKATYVFTTVYNPYKYLWIDGSKNGFFYHLLNNIPQMTILGFEVDELIKEGLLNTPVIKNFVTRVNGMSDKAEDYVTRLNAILRSKITAFQASNPNVLLTDTKAVFDPVPDRPVAAPKHYNDLVNVEYTQGYDIAKMDWGALWAGSDAATFWWNLATKYVSLSGFDINGFASELIDLVITKVVEPDIDPHPEEYGHHALFCSFSDAFGWSALPRRTITFNANGGAGSMAAQTVVALDGNTAYANINALGFSPGAEGYYFTGWNTKADGSGTAYTNGQFIGLSDDLTLYAQWSNIYRVTYKHTNHTNLYGDDETGHTECYALYINGELKPKLGNFSDGNQPTYLVPYGATINVWCNDYVANVISYNDKDCTIYLDGTQVAKGQPASYTFTLKNHVDIEFRWKIAGSIPTLDAQSWEDCYITTK